MYNPGLDGASHTCWSTSTKNVNVHYSSGPGNHFFFMLAEGSGATSWGTSPVCGSAPAVTGIGRTAAAAIWYHAVDAYFTTSTSYVNNTTPSNTARAYTLHSATDLYGLCSTQYKAVQAAWTAVNVAGSDASCATNDFTVSVSPSSATVTAGSGTTATVSTALVTGSAQTIALSASGLPSGATASFSPTSVTTGGSSTLTLSTSASTPAGTYPITITGTGSSATRTTTFTLTIPGAAGCSGTNTGDVTIPDNTTVYSNIAISGCSGNASSASTVDVHIVHTWRGDLVIDLVAPDGTAYRLKNSASSDSADDVIATYTVDASSETAAGTWKLRVQDVASLDTGYINSWKLTF
jgi:hypothetical protein